MEEQLKEIAERLLEKVCTGCTDCDDVAIITTALREAVDLGKRQLHLEIKQQDKRTRHAAVEVLLTIAHDHGGDMDIEEFVDRVQREIMHLNCVPSPPQDNIIK